MANQFQFIENLEHYEAMVNLFKKAKRTLWIGTADIKDLYFKQGIQAVPMLKLLEEIIKHGVEVRLIHAKEPGPNFRADFDKYPILKTHLERVLCPRVHFKLYIIDLTEAYIGSANFTGAAIGMKSNNNRNFEAGILTIYPEIVNRAVNQFDKVWAGVHCKTCGRKLYCGDNINA
ncbi:MAG: phospholipase [Bacteroidia bacterium]|nr:phospholipase [Bacteroidia bacterium]